MKNLVFDPRSWRHKSSLKLIITEFRKCNYEVNHKVLIMSQNKKEQVISHLRYLRQELREMHLGIKEDDLFPEAGEIRGIMAQLEALLELVEGNTKIQSNSEAA